MELWLDAKQGMFGLEAEPSYETEDPRAIECTLDSNLQIEALNTDVTTTAVNNSPLVSQSPSLNGPVIQSRHADLPRIRFLPDGSFSDNSPRTVRLTGRDGFSLWVVQSRNRLSYEIRSQPN